MMMTSEPRERPPTATWLLASDRDERPSVSIHVKKTYALRENGRCTPADLQMPLLIGALPCEEGDIPFHETDIVPFKDSTDLIVMATAFGRGQRSMLATIATTSLRLDYRIVGDRRCVWRGPGSWTFSDPEPFDTMPIRYERAYGGIDDAVSPPEIKHMIDLFGSHPGVYPRNPVGRGYVVYEDRRRIDGLLLPNIEDPRDLLTPERLVVGDPKNWWRQPLPWSCDWFDKEWYPRIAHFGGFPDGLPDDDRQVAEVARGYIPPLQKQRLTTKTLEKLLDPRLANAASPALIRPFLRGDEAVELVGMTPSGRIVVQLPSHRPRLKVRFEGMTTELVPVPNRILISTDEMAVYVVWHGVWPFPRELPYRIPHSDAPALAEANDVEVFADGEVVVPLDASSKPMLPGGLEAFVDGELVVPAVEA